MPRPWTPDKEHQAYKNTIEQAVLGDKMGFHAFWTVEHHFLEEYSHCSNPEVLYGAVAALTENIRIGYGVRLLPKPYNHPIRTAESVAVLDLVSDGRVDFGTGRSSTRAELEGFDVEPDETREMWREALGHIVGAWTEDEYQADGKYWKMGAPAPGAAEAAAAAAPADLRRDEQHPRPQGDGQAAASDCARSPSASRPRCSTGNIAMYREGLAECDEARGQVPQRHRGDVHDGALRADDARRPPRSPRSRSSGTRATAAASSPRSPSGWKSATAPTSAPTSTRATCCARKREGVMSHITIDYLRDSGSAVMGDPDRASRRPRSTKRSGCDLLLCLVNPLKIPHEKVMQSIELMGKYVLPEFK